MGGLLDVSSVLFLHTLGRNSATYDSVPKFLAMVVYTKCRYLMENSLVGEIPTELGKLRIARDL